MRLAYPKSISRFDHCHPITFRCDFDLGALEVKLDIFTTDTSIIAEYFAQTIRVHALMPAFCASSKDSMEPNAHKTNCRDTENRVPMKVRNHVLCRFQKDNHTELLNYRFERQQNLLSFTKHNFGQVCLLASPKKGLHGWGFLISSILTFAQVLFESVGHGAAERWKTRTWPRLMFLQRNTEYI